MIGWFGLVVVALASYRATRLATSDSFTEALRVRLYGWAWNDNHEPPRARAAWRTYVYELFTCPWCLGVWVSAVIFCAWEYSGSEAVRAGLIVLAVAGIQGFIASRADA